MENRLENKEIVKNLSILCFILVFLFGLAYFHNANKEKAMEKTYQKVLALVKEEKWLAASNELEKIQIQSYKDTVTIKTLVSEKLRKEKEVKEQLLKKQEEELKRNQVREIANLLIQGKQVEAQDYMKEHDLSYELYDYAKAIANLENKNVEEAKYIAFDISPGYDGILADEINKFVLTLVDMDWWQRAYQSKKQIEEEADVSSNYPSIGMTDYELKEIWGEPIDINKTTTAEGVWEQWVYPENKYVYLENHYVTAIQD